MKQSIGIVLLVALSAGVAPVAQSLDGQRWWAHVRVLADDSLAGRDAGTAGSLKAAEYVAGHFKRLGIEPAGTQGYLQPVPFRLRRYVEDRSSLTLIAGEERVPLELGEDAYFSMRIESAHSVEAPLVFAGYGLVVPETGHNDLATVDVSGKIVVYISGSPKNVPGPLQAHYQNIGERWSSLKRAGAVGTIAIQNPRGADIPWDRAKLARFQPAMALADPAFDETAGMQIAAVANSARASRLFARSGRNYEELLELARAGEPLPAFPLDASISATIAYDAAEIVSPNVVGILRGTDPKLRNECVVLSAHLDHVGVGEPIKGDRIYNGAMDNASGIATLIEVAAAFGGSGQRPKRSLVFLAVTAEEKGLLGSKYFVGREARANGVGRWDPTRERAWRGAGGPAIQAADRGSIVANINMDMFLPLFPLKSVIAQGLEESDLGDVLREVGRRFGVGVQADPEPERNAFTRSDQYSFIRRGVPALSMKFGFEKDSPEHAIVRRWRTERYHAPSDDLQQPVDIEAAVRFNRVMHALIEAVANRPERPRWDDKSFFKRFAPPEGATAAR